MSEEDLNIVISDDWFDPRLKRDGVSPDVYMPFISASNISSTADQRAENAWKIQNSRSSPIELGQQQNSLQDLSAAAASSTVKPIKPDIKSPETSAFCVNGEQSNEIQDIMGMGMGTAQASLKEDYKNQDDGLDPMKQRDGVSPEFTIPTAKANAFEDNFGDQDWEIVNPKPSSLEEPDEDHMRSLSMVVNTGSDINLSNTRNKFYEEMNTVLNQGMTSTDTTPEADKRIDSDKSNKQFYEQMNTVLNQGMTSTDTTPEADKRIDSDKSNKQFYEQMNNVLNEGMMSSQEADDPKDQQDSVPTDPQIQLTSVSDPLHKTDNNDDYQWSLMDSRSSPIESPDELTAEQLADQVLNKTIAMDNPLQMQSPNIGPTKKAELVSDKEEDICSDPRQQRDGISPEFEIPFATSIHPFKQTDGDHWNLIDSRSSPIELPDEFSSEQQLTEDKIEAQVQQLQADKKPVMSLENGPIGLQDEQILDTVDVNALHDTRNKRKQEKKQAKISKAVAAGHLIGSRTPSFSSEEGVEIAELKEEVMSGLLSSVPRKVHETGEALKDTMRTAGDAAADAKDSIFDKAKGLFGSKSEDKMEEQPSETTVQVGALTAEKLAPEQIGLQEEQILDTEYVNALHDARDKRKQEKKQAKISKAVAAGHLIGSRTPSVSSEEEVEIAEPKEGFMSGLLSGMSGKVHETGEALKDTMHTAGDAAADAKDSIFDKAKGLFGSKSEDKSEEQPSETTVQVDTLTAENLAPEQIGLQEEQILDTEYVNALHDARDKRKQEKKQAKISKAVAAGHLIGSRTPSVSSEEEVEIAEPKEGFMSGLLSGMSGKVHETGEALKDTMHTAGDAAADAKDSIFDKAKGLFGSKSEDKMEEQPSETTVQVGALTAENLAPEQIGLQEEQILDSEYVNALHDARDKRKQEKKQAKISKAVAAGHLIGSRTPSVSSEEEVEIAEPNKGFMSGLLSGMSGKVHKTGEALKDTMHTAGDAAEDAKDSIFDKAKGLFGSKSEDKSEEQPSETTVQVGTLTAENLAPEQIGLQEEQILDTEYVNALHDARDKRKQEKKQAKISKAVAAGHLIGSRTPSVSSEEEVEIAEPKEGFMSGLLSGMSGKVHETGEALKDTMHTAEDAAADAKDSIFDKAKGLFGSKSEDKSEEQPSETTVQVDTLTAENLAPEQIGLQEEQILDTEYVNALHDARDKRKQEKKQAKISKAVAAGHLIGSRTPSVSSEEEVEIAEPKEGFMSGLLSGMSGKVHETGEALKDTMHTAGDAAADAKDSIFDKAKGLFGSKSEDKSEEQPSETTVQVGTLTAENLAPEQIGLQEEQILDTEYVNALHDARDKRKQEKKQAKISKAVAAGHLIGSRTPSVSSEEEVEIAEPKEGFMSGLLSGMSGKVHETGEALKDTMHTAEDAAADAKDSIFDKAKGLFGSKSEDKSEEQPSETTVQVDTLTAENLAPEQIGLQEEQILDTEYVNALHDARDKRKQEKKQAKISKAVAAGHLIGSRTPSVSSEEEVEIAEPKEGFMSGLLSGMSGKVHETGEALKDTMHTAEDAAADAKDSIFDKAKGLFGSKSEDKSEEQPSETTVQVDTLTAENLAPEQIGLQEEQILDTEYVNALHDARDKRKQEKKQAKISKAVAAGHLIGSRTPSVSSEEEVEIAEPKEGFMSGLLSGMSGKVHETGEALKDTMHTAGDAAADAKDSIFDKAKGLFGSKSEDKSEEQPSETTVQVGTLTAENLAPEQIGLQEEQILDTEYVNALHDARDKRKQEKKQAKISKAVAAGHLIGSRTPSVSSEEEVEIAEPKEGFMSGLLSGMSGKVHETGEALKDTMHTAEDAAADAKDSIFDKAKGLFGSKSEDKSEEQPSETTVQVDTLTAENLAPEQIGLQEEQILDTEYVNALHDARDKRKQEKKQAKISKAVAAGHLIGSRTPSVSSEEEVEIAEPNKGFMSGLLSGMSGKVHKTGEALKDTMHTAGDAAEDAKDSIFDKAKGLFGSKSEDKSEEQPSETTVQVDTLTAENLAPEQIGLQEEQILDTEYVNALHDARDKRKQEKKQAKISKAVAAGHLIGSRTPSVSSEEEVEIAEPKEGFMSGLLSGMSGKVHETGEALKDTMHTAEDAAADAKDSIFDKAKGLFGSKSEDKSEEQPSETTVQVDTLTAENLAPEQIGLQEEQILDTEYVNALHDARDKRKQEKKQAKISKAVAAGHLIGSRTPSVSSEEEVEIAEPKEGFMSGLLSGMSGKVHETGEALKDTMHTAGDAAADAKDSIFDKAKGLFGSKSEDKSEEQPSETTVQVGTLTAENLAPEQIGLQEEQILDTEYVNALHDARDKRKQEKKQAKISKAVAAGHLIGSRTPSVSSEEEVEIAEPKEGFMSGLLSGMSGKVHETGEALKDTMHTAEDAAADAKDSIFDKAKGLFGSKSEDKSEEQPSETTVQVDTLTAENLAPEQIGLQEEQILDTEYVNALHDARDKRKQEKKQAKISKAVAAGHLIGSRTPSVSSEEEVEIAEPKEGFMSGLLSGMSGKVHETGEALKDTMHTAGDAAADAKDSIFDKAKGLFGSKSEHKSEEQPSETTVQVYTLTAENLAPEQIGLQEEQILDTEYVNALHDARDKRKQEKKQAKISKAVAAGHLIGSRTPSVSSEEEVEIAEPKEGFMSGLLSGMSGKVHETGEALKDTMHTAGDAAADAKDSIFDKANGLFGSKSEDKSEEQPSETTVQVDTLTAENLAPEQIGLQEEQILDTEYVNALHDARDKRKQEKKQAKISKAVAAGHLIGSRTPSVSSEEEVEIAEPKEGFMSGLLSGMSGKVHKTGEALKDTMHTAGDAAEDAKDSIFDKAKGLFGSKSEDKSEEQPSETTVQVGTLTAGNLAPEQIGLQEEQILDTEYVNALHDARDKRKQEKKQAKISKAVAAGHLIGSRTPSVSSEEEVEIAEPNKGFMSGLLSGMSGKVHKTGEALKDTMHTAGDAAADAKDSIFDKAKGLFGSKSEDKSEEQPSETTVQVGTLTAENLAPEQIGLQEEQILDTEYVNALHDARDKRKQEKKQAKISKAVAAGHLIGSRTPSVSSEEEVETAEPKEGFMSGLLSGMSGKVHETGEALKDTMHTAEDAAAGAKDSIFDKAKGLFGSKSEDKMEEQPSETTVQVDALTAENLAPEQIGLQEEQILDTEYVNALHDARDKRKQEKKQAKISKAVAAGHFIGSRTPSVSSDEEVEIAEPKEGFMSGLLSGMSGKVHETGEALKDTMHTAGDAAADAKDSIFDKAKGLFGSKSEDKTEEQPSETTVQVGTLTAENLAPEQIGLQEEQILDTEDVNALHDARDKRKQEKKQAKISKAVAAGHLIGSRTPSVSSEEEVEIAEPKELFMSGLLSGMSGKVHETGEALKDTMYTAGDAAADAKDSIFDKAKGLFGNKSEDKSEEQPSETTVQVGALTAENLAPEQIGLQEEQILDREEVNALHDARDKRKQEKKQAKISKAVAAGHLIGSRTPSVSSEEEVETAEPKEGFMSGLLSGMSGKVHETGEALKDTMHTAGDAAADAKDSIFDKAKGLFGSKSEDKTEEQPSETTVQVGTLTAENLAPEQIGLQEEQILDTEDVNALHDARDKRKQEKKQAKISKAVAAGHLIGSRTPSVSSEEEVEIAEPKELFMSGLLSGMSGKVHETGEALKDTMHTAGDAAADAKDSIFDKAKGLFGNKSEDKSEEQPSETTVQVGALTAENLAPEQIGLQEEQILDREEVNALHDARDKRKQEKKQAKISKAVAAGHLIGSRTPSVSSEEEVEIAKPKEGFMSGLLSGMSGKVHETGEALKDTMHTAGDAAADAKDSIFDKAKGLFGSKSEDKMEEQPSETTVQVGTLTAENLAPEQIGLQEEQILDTEDVNALHDARDKRKQEKKQAKISKAVAAGHVIGSRTPSVSSEEEVEIAKPKEGFMSGLLSGMSGKVHETGEALKDTMHTAGDAAADAKDSIFGQAKGLFGSKSEDKTEEQPSETTVQVGPLTAEKLVPEQIGLQEEQILDTVDVNALHDARDKRKQEKKQAKISKAVAAGHLIGSRTPSVSSEEEVEIVEPKEGFMSGLLSGMSGKVHETGEALKDTMHTAGDAAADAKDSIFGKAKGLFGSKSEYKSEEQPSETTVQVGTLTAENLAPEQIGLQEEQILDTEDVNALHDARDKRKQEKKQAKISKAVAAGHHIGSRTPSVSSEEEVETAEPKEGFMSGLLSGMSGKVHETGEALKDTMHTAGDATADAKDSIFGKAKGLFGSKSEDKSEEQPSETTVQVGTLTAENLAPEQIGLQDEQILDTEEVNALHDARDKRKQEKKQAKIFKAVAAGHLIGSRTPSVSSEEEVEIAEPKEGFMSGLLSGMSGKVHETGEALKDTMHTAGDAAADAKDSIFGKAKGVFGSKGEDKSEEQPSKTTVQVGPFTAEKLAPEQIGLQEEQILDTEDVNALHDARDKRKQEKKQAKISKAVAAGHVIGSRTPSVSSEEEVEIAEPKHGFMSELLSGMSGKVHETGEALTDTMHTAGDAAADAKDSIFDKAKGLFGNKSEDKSEEQPSETTVQVSALTAGKLAPEHIGLQERQIWDTIERNDVKVEEWPESDKVGNGTGERFKDTVSSAKDSVSIREKFLFTTKVQEKPSNKELHKQPQESRNINTSKIVSSELSFNGIQMHTDSSNSKLGVVESYVSPETERKTILESNMSFENEETGSQSQSVVNAAKEIVDTFGQSINWAAEALDEKVKPSPKISHQEAREKLETVKPAVVVVVKEATSTDEFNKKFEEELKKPFEEPGHHQKIDLLVVTDDTAPIISGSTPDLRRAPTLPLPEETRSSSVQPHPINRDGTTSRGQRIRRNIRQYCNIL